MVRRKPWWVRVALVGLVAAAVTGVGVVPAGSSGGTDDGDPRVIGGTIAPPGSWPSQALLFFAGGDPDLDRICGGTVIDPSWVLTAAHCVTESSSEVIPASAFEVLVGTQDISTGGTRISISEIEVWPGWSYETLTYDMALLRLARPAPVPRVLSVARADDAPPPGTDLRMAGWGQSDAPGDPFPVRLRETTVPAISGPDCEALLDEAREEIFPDIPAYHDTHLCTGPIGTGGRGGCYGDSGGPLVWETGSRRVLVGIASWVVSCGNPEAPSTMFSRVAAGADWLRSTIRFGPHPDETEFQRYAAGRFLFDGEPLPPADDPIAFLVSVMRSREVEERDAAIVRLYDAVLGRGADLWGFDYWRFRMWSSGDYARPASITRVAESMARSAEFQAVYGSLDDGDFVDQIYLNVLGRPADSAGEAFWTGRLAAGATRGAVVAGFSQSQENRARTRGDVDAQVAFLTLIGRAPDAGERAKWSARPVDEVMAFLLHSYAYARAAGFFRAF